jgi:hypothetical protein
MSAAPTSSPKTASYGSWRSPITSDLIVAQSIGLSEVRLDGADVYWIESRPQEQGRSVVVRSEADGRHADITPKPCNARTRVHEYGGGSWTVANGTLYFSNFADGRLYRQVNAGAGLKPAPTSTSGAAAPEPLTPAPPTQGRDWRFADGEIDPRRHWWIGVREDHTGEGEPVNAIAAVDLARPGADPGRVLAGGHDFFSSPRLSPDGKSLLWLAWDHPNMPWNGTTLYMAQIGDSGALGEPDVVAGGKEESIFQPEWSPDGAGIVFVSDRSDGGISTASISRAGTRSRSFQWKRSSGFRSGCSGCPATRLPGAAASSVPIPKRDWVSSPCWTSRADRCARSRRRFRNSARYVPTAIGWYSAPGRLTFPPASSRSISPRAASRS